LQLPFFIARRYLLRQKGAFSSFIIKLAMLATALSVAVMVLTIAFITGFKYEIREKIFSFWGHIHVVPYNVNASNLVTPEPIIYNQQLLDQVSALPHVFQVTPYALRPGILKGAGSMEGIKLKGITSHYRMPKKVQLQGSLIDFSDTAYSKQIIISQSTADRLEWKKNESLQIYFLEPGATLPRVRKVTVAGIYHTGMEEIDKEFAICDIRLLQRINNWEPNEINGYQVDLDDQQYADTTAAIIFDRYLEAPLASNTMRDIYPNIFDWLEVQDVNAQIILAIMTLVAIINLAGTLMILIVEQARMVGILKTLGMSDGKTQQIFLYHAGLIATAGILAGNILALGICWLQERTGFMKLSESTYYMSQVPVRLYWWHIVLIDIATLVLCLLCMWLPTLYIRRIHPARVIQFK
jgi:lipoprotein-releasing system permease protein